MMNQPKRPSAAKVYGYIRISTDSQSNNTSLSVQKERIDAWAKSQGIPAPVIIEDISSGANLNRPGIEKLKSDLQRGDRVVVFRLDRLSRSVVDAAPLIENWHENGVSLHSVSEPIETHTPIGRAMLKMILVFAEAKRELIQSRMLSGKQKKAQEGGFNGCPIPYGYRPGLEGENDFEPVKTEAMIVEALFKRYARGDIGITRLKRITECPLSEPAIHELLSSVFYTGRIQYAGVVAFNNHAPIVTDRTFNRVQEVKRRRSRRPANGLYKVVEGKSEIRNL